MRATAFVLSFSALASLAAAAVDDATLASLKTELLAWKSSPAGLQAKQRGFISSITETTQEEIARFASAKSKLTQLQKQQPSAVFSLNTPYALLTSKEYATQTMTPLSAGELTDLLASADLSAVATNTTAQSKAHFSTLAVDVPDVDWVRYGCVTRVQDQGACNAGYVFSVVGAIETGYCIKSPTRTLYDLSEQDPLTCGSYTSCRSGAPSFVYNWITTLNGGSLCTDASLPYTRGDFMSQPCTRYEDPNVWCNKPDLQVATFEQKQFADHRELEAIVRQRAVTAVVTPCPAFQYYSSGVLRGDEYNCPAPSDFNSPGTHHEVLIVGFGTRDGIPYWKVKNSDGTSWGEGGYAYIERGYQGGPFGAAGIEMWNTYPLFKSDVPNFDGLRVTGPRYNVEIIGNDLKIVMIQMGLGEDCATICRREPGCKAYSLRNDGSRLCRFKSSVSGEVRYSFDQDGLLYYSGAVITRDEMKGYCLAPEYNYDFPGNDVDVAAASSPEQCCDLCFGNRLCEAYTWTQFHGGMCYLKSRRAVKPEWKAPASDGSAYFASGVVYKCQPLQFNTDFPGNDLESVQASGPMDCCGICRNSLKCVGFSWTNFNGGTCWLKSRIPASGIGSYANGVYAAAI